VPHPQNCRPRLVQGRLTVHRRARTPHSQNPFHLPAASVVRRFLATLHGRSAVSRCHAVKSMRCTRVERERGDLTCLERACTAAGRAGRIRGSSQ